MKNRIVGLLILAGLAIGHEAISGCRSCYITYQQPAASVTQRAIPARGVYSGAMQAGLRAPVRPMPVRQVVTPAQSAQNSKYGPWTQARQVPSVYTPVRPVRQRYPASRFSMYNGAKAATPVRQEQETAEKMVTLEKEGQIEQLDGQKKQQNGVQKIDSVEQTSKEDSDKIENSADTIDAMVDAIVASGREEEKMEEVKGEKKEQGVLA